VLDQEIKMEIAIALSPETEKRLREKAAQQGREISLVAAELLTSVLEWEEQDSQQAIEGIQQGLNDFEAGRFRCFNEFANEQRRKYNLPADS
jgi:predicted transcriptional regulator